MSILDEIFAHKRDEVAVRKVAKPLGAIRAEAEAAPPALGFAEALREARTRTGSPALIAEVKGRSPSRGKLVERFDPLRLAQTYAANGAATISVLTDERYFGGSLAHLRLIREMLDAELGPDRPPLLRKDFVCDPYQVYEARAAGADAVLLIVAHLAPALLRELHELARSLTMAALVEVHTAAEAEAGLGCGASLVGINNRDLHDFRVDVNTTVRLRPLLPAGVTVVTESGIHSQDDVARLAAAGVDAMLIGEALVTAPNVASRVRGFAGKELSHAR